MSALLFVLVIAALALCGGVIAKIPFVASLEWSAKIAIAFATGLFIATILMFATSVVHIEWSRTLFILLLAPLAIYGAFSVGRRRPRRRAILATTPIALILILKTWAVLGARETCSDYAFFWAPKAEHFWLARSIDVAFLADPANYFMHPDYPPLLSQTYAWGALMSGNFSWWGGLLFTPLCFLAMTVAFRGIAERAIGERSARMFATLILALIAFASQLDPVAGAGEPPLLLFELIALAALTFAPEDRGALLVASIVCAAAVLTKVEGTMFSAIVAVAFVLAQRRIKDAIAFAIAPAIAFGAWMLFIRHHKLLDIYGVRERAHFENIGRVLKALAVEQMSYAAWYLPLIAAIAPMLFAKTWRRAAFPLLVAAGSFAAAVFVYLHAEDPTFFIASSAHRLLLTPLMCLAVASASTSE